MPSTLLERASSLQGHPNITTAARFLGVSPATISRRDDLARERRGERDVVLAPREVMRLADVYRKRSLNEVAAMLVAHAEEHAPAEAQRVEEEIETFIDERQSAPQSDADFLAMAEELLPAKLYQEVKRTLAGRGAARPRAVLGSVPKALPGGARRSASSSKPKRSRDRILS